MSLDFQRLERVLAEAAAKGDFAERAAFLDQACGEDRELRAEVERLVAAHEKAGDFLETPVQPISQAIPGKPARPSESDNGTECVGVMIGRYKPLEEIGEGGFGVVYMAEQLEPVHRKVALKIIKAGMDTREVVARFEAERQALALMDHPNIAQVFDGGITQAGRPYFVMELVRGIAVTDFCDQRRLSTRDRLQLFIQVCHAVQHAHQKGIIHRDLKPSNILVTLIDGEAVPKIIDFGVAKALGQRLTDKTLFTGFLKMVGTPAYMSPEQADLSGVDIDTRTDIYALGVLLYELLTGVTPFDTETLRRAALDEVRRMIRETEPSKPSTRLHALGNRLAEVAKQRQTEPAALGRLVRGDLDWIVMKCLEKDRRRRYDTANNLADDVGRYLNHEPVTAAAPSTVYRARKFIGRHKTGLATATALAVLLAVGAAVSTWQAVRATRAEHQQAKQKMAAEQFLYKALVGEARATRLARRVGYRDRVFALLQQAKELDVPQRNLGELRLEAVACLGDFVGLKPVTLNDFPTNIVACCLDPTGTLAAFELHDRTIQLRALPSGEELARLRSPEGTFQSFSFNAAGDQLFATYESPPSSRIYGWTRRPDGHWRETVNRYARPVTGRLLSSEAGVFAIEVSLLPSDESHAGSIPNDGVGKPAGGAQTLGAGETADVRMRFRLIRLDTGTFVPGLDMIAGSFTNWAATPDGRRLAVTTVDSRKPHSAVVNLYDWKAGTRLNQLSVCWPSAMSLSEDGNYLACLSAEGAEVYSLSSLDRVGHLKRFFFGADAAVFRATTVALPRQQQSRIHLWDFATGEEIALLDEPEEASPVAFTAKGDALLTFGAHHARLYHLETPEKLDLPAHNAAVPGIAFSPDGTRLASVGKDHVVRVCDTLTGRTLWETNDLPGEGQCIAYSPDGRWLVLGLWDRNLVWIRDAQTGVRLLEPQTDRPGQTFSTQFSPDGRFLAMAGSVAGMQAEGEVADGIKVWRFEGGKSGNPDGALKVTLVRSWTQGSGLVFAPDGRSVAFSDPGQGVRASHLCLWEFECSPEPHRVGFQGPGAVQGCDFTPDGHRLLAIDDDGAVVTTDVGTGEQISSFQVWNSQTMGTASRDTQFLNLSPDGSRLAVSSPSRLGVEIRHPSTGEILYSLREEAGTVFWLAWSPDSRRIAVSRDNGNIAIWNLDIIDQTLAQLELNP